MILLLDTESTAKGQLILKADWRAINSPKKQTDGFILFSFLLFAANKSNSSASFLGESAFQFYLTFSWSGEEIKCTVHVALPKRPKLNQ